MSLAAQRPSSTDVCSTVVAVTCCRARLRRRRGGGRCLLGLGLCGGLSLHMKGADGGAGVYTHGKAVLTS